LERPPRLVVVVLDVDADAGLVVDLELIDDVSATALLVRDLLVIRFFTLAGGPEGAGIWWTKFGTSPRSTSRSALDLSKNSYS
jgi:hypothetical protein